MIRNLIDYSEYRVQRSDFEFWDQLVINKILVEGNFAKVVVSCLALAYKNFLQICV